MAAERRRVGRLRREAIWCHCGKPIVLISCWKRLSECKLSKRGFHF
jgi:hypothetical protein